MNRNKHIGSDLRDFLKDEGILEEVESRAVKRALVMELEATMHKHAMSKVRLATRMRTSRAALDRLLDPDNTSVTLTTLEKAALALGRKVRIHLVAA